MVSGIVSGASGASGESIQYNLVPKLSPKRKGAKRTPEEAGSRYTSTAAAAGGYQCRVAARVTGRTILRVARIAARLEKALETQISKRIGADKLANLGNRFLRRNQFCAGRSVNTVVAW
jgi:hypothetical protein